MQRTKRAAEFAFIADALAAGDELRAKEIAASKFQWERTASKRKGISSARALRVFVRDRFIDRYSSSKLLFPGALLAVAVLLPEQFPTHPNWKAGESHHVFWELWPVIDHVVPVTRGGIHDESNFVTTSTNNNNAKGNALLEEIEWKLRPEPGPEETWDGLLSWYLRIIEIRPEILSNSQVMAWHKALGAINHSQRDGT
ncbi:MAG: HNH endonuclease [Betaproteobacteria bacterium]|nr:HNH endonuclease [Betaproteobacteria bacterium]